MPAMVRDSLSVSTSPGVLLELHLIGQMQAVFPAGRSVLPVGRKTRALLAIVSLMAPRPVLRGRIAELLWSRRPEEQARASLRQEVHRLMETLAPYGEQILHVTRDHIGLRPGAVWIDVAEVLAANAENPGPLARLEGELLEGLDGLDPGFDLWLTTERERLHDRGRTLAEKLLSGDLEPEEAIPAAQRLLQIDRAHEGAWRALMRAHATRGERGMAIQAYDRCRTALADLLDAAPSLETERLLNEIRGPVGRRPSPIPPANLAEPHAEPLAPGPARGGAHIGILPLALVGGEAVDADLAQGLAEELSAALSRFRWVYVVAPTSLARYAGAVRDDNAIRRVFGLQYLIEGSVHHVRDRIRVNLRLVNLLRPSEIVWTGRFERKLDNRLDLEEEVSEQAATQIEAAVLNAAWQPAPRLAPDAGGYETMLRALPLMQRLDMNSFREAGTLLQRAIEEAPELAPAHVWRTLWRAITAVQRWHLPNAESVDEAMALAGRTVQLDPLDARGLAAAGFLRTLLAKDLDAAAALNDRALTLNPHLAMAWSLSAYTLTFRGELAEAELRAARYKHLSPADPWSAWLDPVIPLIALLRGEFARAVETARPLTQVSPGSRLALLVLLSALGHLGETQSVAPALGRLQAIEAGVSASHVPAEIPLARGVDRDLLVEGLLNAGVTH
jgi:DNA-binding SARP family transcriptional activator/TolB-like protein